MWLSRTKFKYRGPSKVLPAIPNRFLDYACIRPKVRYYKSFPNPRQETTAPIKEYCGIGSSSSISSGWPLCVNLQDGKAALPHWRVRTTFRGGAGVLGPGQQPGRALLLDDLHAGQRHVAKATFKRTTSIQLDAGGGGVGGLQEDVVYLCWPIAPIVYEPKCVKRGGRGCGVSANENGCAHHVTWCPNKLRRSNSLFNLWLGLSTSIVQISTVNFTVH